MNRLQKFLDNNHPARAYRIVKRTSLRFGKYSIELRLLREEGEI